MNPSQLLAHFDRISDAPDAVPRLRTFILDLAVRGKLVEQQSADEPASALLQRVDAERTRLVKEKILRNVKVPSPPSPDEIPCELPTGWEWSRLSILGDIGPRNEVDDAGDVSFLPMATIADGFSGKIEPEVRKWGEIKKGFTHVADGDIAMAKITPCFQNRKSAVMRGLKNGVGAGTTELHVVRPLHGALIPEYALLQLKSATYLDVGVSKMTGTAGQKRVPKEYFADTPFPLPPLAEQRRIVAKVDELMALCDRLEAAQAEREKRRESLTRASLHRLNNGADPDAFRTHARFHLTHLPRLTTRPEHIKALRQTILNLAVRGKLVPQDPSDGAAPAFDVISNAGAKDRIDLLLPTGWSWARVSDVADSRLGKMLDKAKNSGKHYPYLRNTNVHWFEFRLDEIKTIKIADSEFETFLLRDGDVLICEGGHGIGRTAVWRSNGSHMVFQKALHRVRPSQLLVGDYFAYCIFVYFHCGILEKYYTGVGIPHFTGVSLSKLVFPLPPLAEQHRIVAKVDELMALCDRLETQLTTGQTESRRLLEAILHEALAPN